MATLDDKLLGEKLHYYCSSSEDEGDNGDSDNDDLEDSPVQVPSAPPPVGPTSGRGGGSGNTGPKGVLKDWRRFKQLETEKRQEAEEEKLALAKKLSLTCRTTKEDEEASKEAELDLELEALLEDEYLETYMARRMKEMMEATQNSVKRFGKLIELPTGESFLSHVDDEDKKVTVIVLIHEPGVAGCGAMMACLSCLAPEHPSVKFCSILSSAARLSQHFKVSGVPALLVYRAGQLVGSWVRLTDLLGEDFFSGDLEQFLVEHGMLQDRDIIPSRVRGPGVQNCDDSD